MYVFSRRDDPADCAPGSFIRHAVKVPIGWVPDTESPVIRIAAARRARRPSGSKPLPQSQLVAFSPFVISSFTRKSPVWPGHYIAQIVALSRAAPRRARSMVHAIGIRTLLPTRRLNCMNQSKCLTWNLVKAFKPLRPLRNGHLMTIASGFWRRKFPRLPASVTRHFEVESGTKVRGECHWQQDPLQHPTLVVLHGLEGSSESGYILGTAEKAWLAGFNVVRLNQRNCGGTEHLTETLYHSGLSGDIRAVCWN